MSNEAHVTVLLTLLPSFAIPAVNTTTNGSDNHHDNRNCCCCSSSCNQENPVLPPLKADPLYHKVRH